MSLISRQIQKLWSPGHRKTCQVLLENEGEKDAQGPFYENVKNKTPTVMAGVFYSLTE